ncbi:MAG: SH3 domain-containing protein [Parvularculaceae bacterium]
MRRGLAFIACILLAHMTAPVAAAQVGDGPPVHAGAKVRTDTPSGYPVPRFVSLKSAKTYCRLGPTFRHPVRYTYLRKGLPVLVVAETTDHWRKIRDSEGAECWAHKSKLSGERTVLVVEEGLALRVAPETGAAARARLAAGVIARLMAETDGWRRIEADGVRGWAPAPGLWGAERFSTQEASRD